MKDIIETLYPMNRYLVSPGYDTALDFIKHLVELEIIEIPSGTEIGTWMVPDEWVIREAWVKNEKGEKIIDFKKDPLSVMSGSCSVDKIMPASELIKYLKYSDTITNAIPYTYTFYEDRWGFNVKKNDYILSDGENMKWKFPEGNYHVFIDSEHKPGMMKIGVHTIKGKSDREILLFAHLDHPFQADDNLSGVACLLNLVNKLKCEHTVKLVFCPETIGSIAYALTQDISKVDFVIAVDICGNKNDLVLQRSLKDSKINNALYLALRGGGESFRMGKFKSLTGSDEYVFNDPNINIPGIMLTRFPYDYYHTSDDNPERIDYKQIEKVSNAIIKAIEIYEKDFIPVKKFKGPLMRSRYGCQQSSHQLNLPWDYLFYGMDDNKTLAELCVNYTLDFDTVYEVINKLEKDGKISRANAC